MPDPLYLVQIPLDPQGVFRASKGRQGPGAPDTGYLVHATLTAVFSPLIPQPFALAPARPRRIEVLAYSRHSPEALAEHGAANADADVRARVHWTGLRGKRMPDVLPSGHRLRFEVRACPVVRKSAAGRTYKAGAEVDAFLAEVEKAGREVVLDRQEIYRSWFRSTTERTGAMRCLQVDLRTMRRLRLTRRDRARRFAVLERPDVTFEGLLEVTEPDAFQALLGRGIGRHRAFGFGMLLLRPA